jgi:hypothetical protein
VGQVLLEGVDGEEGLVWLLLGVAVEGEMR